MKKHVGYRVLSTLMAMMFMAAVVAQAQPTDHDQPPKLLVIFREWVKPGKTDSLHEKSEAAYVRAMAQAKEPNHYLALKSMSGKQRALFITTYDSFEAWEKDIQWMGKNKTLTAELDRVMQGDGQLLEYGEQGIFRYSPDLSYNVKTPTGKTRYFEIESFDIKEGHYAEWEQAVKMVKEAYAKSVPEANWITFYQVLGPEGHYLMFMPLDSLKEIDIMFGWNKKFMDTLGPDGMKKLEALSGASIAHSEMQLLAISPAMSYMGEDWMKQDPGFWKTKAMAPAAKKPAAQKPEAKM